MKGNNKLVRRLAAGALGATLLCGVAAAASTVTTKTLNANYMGIQIVVDGVAITPKDANGNAVDPFVCDGTTYLPVRAIGEVLGKTVTWDGETKTVYVGTVPGTEENWMVKLPPYQTNGLTKVYDGTNPKETFTVGGVTKTSGIVLASTWYSGSIYAMWNTNAQYKSMTFTIANGNGDWDTTLEVYLDGDFSTSYDVKWDGGARTITVPLNYAANVKLALTNIAEYCIYDISFSE